MLCDVSVATANVTCRLPQFNRISLHFKVHPNPAAMAMQLGAMRTQLLHLRSLDIDSSKQWPHHSAAAWQQLGSITQLTRLVLNFNNSAHAAFRLKTLSELGRIQRLQELSVTAWGAVRPQQGSELHFLSKLTVLTSLTLSVPSVAGLSSISSCCKLRSLMVLLVPHAHQVLTAAECEAVGKLTRLTKLVLGWRLDPPAVPVLHSSLQKLRQLEYVRASPWTPAVLPVLAGLTKLTTVRGAWEADEQSSSSSSSCPHVQHLAAVSGNVPFKAFPNILTCSYYCGLTSSAVASLRLHCTQLQSLVTAGGEYPPANATSLLGAAADEARVAAMNSLAQLSALQTLTWHAQNDDELAALAAGARALTSLRVVLPQASTVSVCGLMQLGKVLQLKELHLRLYSSLRVTLTEARMLLCNLCHVPQVVIMARHPNDSMFRAASTAAALAGLPVANASVQGIDSLLTSDEEDETSSEEMEDEFEEEDEDDPVPFAVPIHHYMHGLDDSTSSDFSSDEEDETSSDDE